MLTDGRMDEQTNGGTDELRNRRRTIPGDNSSAEVKLKAELKNVWCDFYKAPLKMHTVDSAHKKQTNSAPW